VSETVLDPNSGRRRTGTRAAGVLARADCGVVDSRAPDGGHSYLGETVSFDLELDILDTAPVPLAASATHS
jgi:hypothetical protein